MFTFIYRFVLFNIFYKNCRLLQNLAYQFPNTSQEDTSNDAFHENTFCTGPFFPRMDARSPSEKRKPYHDERTRDGKRNALISL